MGSLKGQVSIVTGAAQGIGAEYAGHLASLGATVIVADIAEKAAEETSRRLRDDGLLARATPVDISKPESCQRLVDDVVATEGRIDILVNNAALYSGLKLFPAEEIPLDIWQRYVD